MPQLQNLVLTDRATTPVNHTFVPRGIADGIAVVAESSGVPIGDKTVSIWSRKTREGNFRITLKYAFPVIVTETINGVSVPKLDRVSRCEVEFQFAATSTAQERKDTVGQVYSSLAASATLVDKTLVDLEGIY